MEEKKPQKRSILNIFDIVVIIIAIALAAVLFLYKSGGTEAVLAETGTVTYTIELTSLQNYSTDLISEGDKLVDNIKKYDIGTIKSVDVTNTVRQAKDMESGATYDVELDSLKTAIIVVESECTETDTQITVAGGYTIRVGLSVNVKGPGYYGTGYIIAVDRGE